MQCELQINKFLSSLSLELIIIYFTCNGAQFRWKTMFRLFFPFINPILLLCSAVNGVGLKFLRKLHILIENSKCALLKAKNSNFPEVNMKIEEFFLFYLSAFLLMRKSISLISAANIEYVLAYSNQYLSWLLLP